MRDIDILARSEEYQLREYEARQDEGRYGHHAEDEAETPQPRRTTCVRCGRRPSVYGEGRWIDGSWADDQALMRKYANVWVCCHSCYAILKMREEGRK